MPITCVITCRPPCFVIGPFRSSLSLPSSALLTFDFEVPLLSFSLSQGKGDRAGMRHVTRSPRDAHVHVRHVSRDAIKPSVAGLSADHMAYHVTCVFSSSAGIPGLNANLVHTLPQHKTPPPSPTLVFTGRFLNGSCFREQVMCVFRG